MPKYYYDAVGSDEYHHTTFEAALDERRQAVEDVEWHEEVRVFRKREIDSATKNIVWMHASEDFPRYLEEMLLEEFIDHTGKNKTWGDESMKILQRLLRPAVDYALETARVYQCDHVKTLYFEGGKLVRAEMVGSGE